MNKGDSIGHIASQSIVSAPGRQVAVQIGIPAEQLGNRSFLFHRIAGITGSVAGCFQTADFGPESGPMSKYFQIRKLLQRSFELGQPGIIIQTVVASDSIGNIEYQGESHILYVPEQILHERIAECKVGHYFTDAFASPVPIPPQKIPNRRIRRVRQGPRIDVAEGDKRVRISINTSENLLVGLRQVYLCVYQGKQNSFLYPDFSVSFEQLLRQ